MFADATILRLFVSQIFSVYFILLMLTLKEPKQRNIKFVIMGAFLITFINALLIHYIGISFYIRYYLFTLTLPYIFLGLYFSIYKGARFIFVILSIQVISNVAIINGLLASYVFYGENNPLIDTVARTLTYLIFLPIVAKIIRPTFFKMTEVIKNGWWMLNASLVLAYALAYYILFVPDAIFNRPEYFVHAYIGTVLSLLIYAVIFYLFIEIQSKINFEQDTKVLTTKVSSLVKETAEISTIAYKDSLTGLKNRYFLYKQMNQYIQNKQDFLVIFIDLDNLKLINDAYDHSVGDAYLKQFANALQTIVNNKDNVYRFGGDEFICLSTNLETEFNSNDFRQSIAAEMIMDVPYYGISLGLAQYPKDGVDSDELIKSADQVMYVEKRIKQKYR